MDNIEYLEVRLPTMERLLILSWLLKDFGWMTTNIYLGFPFGVISILLHMTMIIIERRPAFRFYNYSLFFWVVGNFIWMTLEFVCTQPSSDVHIGPPVPLGGINSQWYTYLVQFKTVLFAIGACIQIYMYVGIIRGSLEIPTETNENPLSQNEANLIFCRKTYEIIDSSSGGRNYISSTSNSGSSSNFNQLDANNSLLASDSESNSGHNIRTRANQDVSLAFLDNAYIILWILKDTFWSWGTGDLNYRDHAFAVTSESFGIMFGSLAVCINIVNAYVHRLDVIRLTDSVTTIFWILANYLWMSGEYFIRYHNMDYDDTNPGHDDATRIASACCFSIGIVMQIFLISYLSIKFGCSPLCSLCGRLMSSKDKLRGGSAAVELVALSPAVMLSNISVSMSTSNPMNTDINSSGTSIESNSNSSSNSNNHNNNSNSGKSNMLHIPPNRRRTSSTSFFKAAS